MVPFMLRELSMNSVVKRCDHCALHAYKGLGFGNPDAPMLLLGQNPGPPDLKVNPQRRPFQLNLWESKQTFKAADVLRRAMTDQGFTLADAYVTNAMKCEGKVEERYIDNCSDWLESELVNLINLRLIVAMGLVAGKRINLTRPFTIQWYTSRLEEERRWTAVYVNHPAAVLYPGGISRRDYEQQWAFVRAVFKRLVPEKA